MDLHHLRCFVALAEELNFRRAAERLHMTQPPLTRLIARLEDDLGVKLVQRTTRKVKLTTAGEILLVDAKELLAKAEQTVWHVRQTAAREEGRLGIAFSKMALYGVVPKILPAFRDRFPQIQVDVLEICTEQQVEALKTARIDIGFLHPPLRANFLGMLSIGKERLMIALPDNHPLAFQAEVALQDLAQETFLLHPREEGPVLYDQILELCRQAEFTPKVVHKASNQTFLGLVTARVGICFIAPSIKLADPLGIVFVPLAGIAPTLEYAVAWRQGDPSPFVHTFLEMIRENQHQLL
jgi:DNA-binding transcriptional LysR family regulator